MPADSKAGSMTPQYIIFVLPKYTEYDYCCLKFSCVLVTAKREMLVAIIFGRFSKYHNLAKMYLV